MNPENDGICKVEWGDEYGNEKEAFSFLFIIPYISNLYLPSILDSLAPPPLFYVLNYMLIHAHTMRDNL